MECEKKFDGIFYSVRKGFLIYQEMRIYYSYMRRP